MTVPSLDSRSVTTSSVENGTESASDARRAFGSVVMSSYGAPRAVHSHTWRARYAGSPALGQGPFEQGEIHARGR